MSQNEEKNAVSLFLIADLKDLSCPICYVLFGEEEKLPITLHCGHSVCSFCLERINACPICKRLINQQQRPQKSVALCSMIESINKNGRCKDHRVPSQGFCEQDKTFVCFDCLMEKHKGHDKISTIKQVNEKAKELSLETKKIYDKEKSRRLEIRQSLDEINKNLKRKIDEKYEREIEEFSLTKKRLYKDVDLVILTEKDHYEHKLLSENLLKYCKITETTIENWNIKQEENLAFRILDNPLEKISQEMNIYDEYVDFLKREILQKQVQYMGNLSGDLQEVTIFFTGLIGPILSRDSSKIERDYFVEVFKAYNMTAAWTQENQLLEIQTSDFFTVPPEINKVIIGVFSFGQLSLKCSEMPSSNIFILCQILETAIGLQDLALDLQKITDEDLKSLSDLFKNFKYLSEFSIRMNLKRTSEVAVKRFFDQITSLREFSSFTLQSNGMEVLITLKLTNCFFFLKEFQKMSLSFKDVPPLLLNNFLWLLECSIIAEMKSFKTLKILLGKKEKNSRLSSSLCQILEAQIDLEKLDITTFEDSNPPSEDHLLKLLPSALSTRNNLKKFRISVNQATQETAELLHLIPEFDSLMLQNLEELTLHINHSQAMETSVREGMIWRIWNFLFLTRTLKKFALKFDGLNLYSQATHELFDEILKKQNLVELQIEFGSFQNFHSSEEIRSHLNSSPSYASYISNVS